MDYIHIESNDDYSFYTERKIFEQSDTMKDMIKNKEELKLNYSGEVVEYVIDYLNYKVLFIFK
jgi:hypothetical protein